MPSQNKTVLHRIVDKLMPDNCRTQLKAAAAANTSEHDEVMCLLSEFKKKVFHAN